jgi:hypothetical protein
MSLAGKFRNNRGKTILGLVGVAIATTVISAVTTGSFFSDTHSGAITGTVGTIKVTTSGGSGADGMNFTFDKLLPGEPQTVTLSYQNTGDNPQDVWLAFQNDTARSALNDMGTYGEVHISANGVEKFASKNLNDHPTCPPGSTSAAHPEPCAALPDKIQVADNVAPGATGVVKFSFNYADKLTGSGGGVWNTYPVSGQTTVKASDGSGNGLPWQLVAVQVGKGL